MTYTMPYLPLHTSLRVGRCGWGGSELHTATSRSTMFLIATT